MESICLTSMPLPDSITAPNIAEWLEEVAARFEIPPSKNIAIVHDSGAKVMVVANIQEEKHRLSSVRCTGHVWQLVINSALKHQRSKMSCGTSLFQQLSTGLYRT